MTAPDSYISWRMSMGFSEEESERLYNLIDSSNEFELRAYLQSRDSKHYEKIGMASSTFQFACDRLVNSGPTRMKIGMMVTLFNTSMIRNLDVAMMGRYNESFQLMRSSIESGLRLCFNLMKVYESEFFDDFLSNIDWKDDDPPWGRCTQRRTRTRPWRDVTMYRQNRFCPTDKEPLSPFQNR